MIRCNFLQSLKKFCGGGSEPPYFYENLVISLNSWVESKFLHAQRKPKLCTRLLPTFKAWLLSTRSFSFNGELDGVFEVISNGNWTEWKPTQGVIAQVISKSEEREAQGRFEILTEWSTIQGVIMWVISKSEERKAQGRFQITTEWSTIQGVIARVISKSEEHETRGRFEITTEWSTIQGVIARVISKSEEREANLKLWPSGAQFRE